MTTVVCDTLVTRMQTAPYDILSLQETHRAEQSGWKAGQWYFYQLAGPQNSLCRGRCGHPYDCCGTLHRQMPTGLPVIPGRLLHVRLSGGTYGIDLLSCYQHVISSMEQQSVNASKREQFWTKLGRCTATLPQRNLLIVAGDFSCAARPNFWNRRRVGAGSKSLLL